MQRIVGKPIYIRFYDEFPSFCFRCSVRVCCLALWMVWVVLLYNSLHSIAVQQAQEVIRKYVYLYSIFFFFFFGLMLAFSLFAPPQSLHLAETLALALNQHRIRINFYYFLPFFCFFPSSYVAWKISVSKR